MKEQRKKLWKFLPLALSVAFIALYFCLSKADTLKFLLPFDKVYDYNDILIVYVADGDTVRLEDGSWVRLIGIDSPEYHDSNKLLRDARRRREDIATIKKMGAMSYAFTRGMLENKRVRLEFDVEKYDKYDRLLAYIFLPDGTFINAEIVENGYGQTMSIPPNTKYAGLLARLEDEAKVANRGLWERELDY